MARSKAKIIKDDLIQQLEIKGMYHSFYRDFVDQYVEYFNMKNKLMKDIKEKGVRVEVTSGNGFTTSKANESIMLCQKTTQMMLKILNDLGLQEPVVEETTDDDYL